MPGYELFGEEERRAINDLFDLNGGVLFAHGFDNVRKGVYRVREFEKAMALKVGVSYAQAVSSGTAALKVALESIGIGKGDQVIIPAFTFVATAEAVLQTGAELVIVDIDDTYTINPKAVEQAITKKTKAIIPVHMMGAPAEMNLISQLAIKHNLAIIEDSAQAVGGTFRGRYLGTIGDLGCFSFDAGKVLNTGEGGMVITNTENYFKRARSYHDHGHEYSSSLARGQEGAVGVGFNYRMTEIQACIGLVQLAKLELIVNTQRFNKARLKEKLINSGISWKFRRILDEGEIGDCLIIKLPDREITKSFITKLKLAGIGTKNLPDSMRWHFAKHWSHMFQRYDIYSKTYDIQWLETANLLETSIAIPIFVKMSDKDIDKTALTLNSIASDLGL